jgi:hypothetical protein
MVIMRNEWKSTFMRVAILMHCQSDLAHVVRTLGAPPSSTSRLHGRQQERDQNANDGNHNQQLD